MERIACYAGLVLVTLAANGLPDEPRPPESHEIPPVTEQMLVGEWTSRDESISVKFQPIEKNQLAATVSFRRGVAQQLSLVEYRIDAKRNEVYLLRPVNAVAKPTKDGALLLSCEVDLAGTKYLVKDERLEQQKPGPGQAEPSDAAGSR